MTFSTATVQPHKISRHRGVHTSGRLRARCTCAWFSDGYAMPHQMEQR